MQQTSALLHIATRRARGRVEITMLLLIEFVMFYTFMYLGTKCPDYEIRNADFAEIDLIGITVHLRLFCACAVARGH